MSRGGGGLAAPRKPFSRAAMAQQQRLARLQKQQTSVAAMEEVGTEVSVTLDEELDKESMYKRFDELLANFDFVYKPGDKVTGVIFRVDARGAYVDIGAKGAAFMPAAEVSLCRVDRVRGGFRWPSAGGQGVQAHDQRLAGPSTPQIWGVAARSHGVRAACAGV